MLWNGPKLEQIYKLCHKLKITQYRLMVLEFVCFRCFWGRRQQIWDITDLSWGVDTGSTLGKPAAASKLDTSGAGDLGGRPRRIRCRGWCSDLSNLCMESLLCIGEFLTPSLGLRHEPRVTASTACVLKTCSRRGLAVAILGEKHLS